MSASVISLRPAPPDPFAELQAERERLGRELDRFAIVDERLNASTAKIAEVDQALSALDRADREAVLAWAASAEGEPPAPMLAERRALLARRLDADAERQGAEIAVAAVAAKRTALIHAMNAVGVRIREVQVAGALDDARRLHAEALKLVVDVGECMMKLEGLRLVLVDEQSGAANRRDAAQEATFRVALAKIEVMRVSFVMADSSTVARFAAEWRGKLR
jgi:hypothetical protein